MTLFRVFRALGVQGEIGLRGPPGADGSDGEVGAQGPPGLPVRIT